MDLEHRRFDDLTRLVSAATTRRVTLAAVLAAILRLLIGDGAGARRGPRLCRPLGRVCVPGRGLDCCGGTTCRRGRCRCQQGRRRCRGRCISKRRCCGTKDCRGGKSGRRGRCGGGQKRCGGRCVPKGTCCGSKVNCGGRCVDRRTDRRHCGKCGIACDAGQSCKAGTCQPACDVCPRGCDFDSVDAAIEAAAAGGTVRVCPGTYREQISINKDVTVIGAGPGRTILDGGGTARNFPVLFITPGERVRIQDLTVTGGNANGNGGGIINTAFLTLVNVNVIGNTAGGNGGGIFNNIGRVTLTDCKVTGNTATGEGGGIYNRDGGTVTIKAGTTVANNTPDNCAGDPVDGSCPNP